MGLWNVRAMVVVIVIGAKDSSRRNAERNLHAGTANYNGHTLQLSEIKSLNCIHTTKISINTPFNTT